MNSPVVHYDIRRYHPALRSESCGKLWKRILLKHLTNLEVFTERRFTSDINNLGTKSSDLA